VSVEDLLRAAAGDGCRTFDAEISYVSDSPDGGVKLKLTPKAGGKTHEIMFGHGMAFIDLSNEAPLEFTKPEA
jgi:hypothetical protein